MSSKEVLIIFMKATITYIFVTLPLWMAKLSGNNI